MIKDTPLDIIDLQIQDHTDFHFAGDTLNELGTSLLCLYFPGLHTL